MADNTITNPVTSSHTTEYLTSVLGTGTVIKSVKEPTIFELPKEEFTKEGLVMVHFQQRSLRATVSDIISAGYVAPDWTELTNLPDTFPPDSHSHAWTTITDKPATFPPEAHDQAWTTITGKPAEFPAVSHTHAWDDITGKPEVINGVDGVSPEFTYDATTKTLTITT